MAREDEDSSQPRKIVVPSVNLEPLGRQLQQLAAAWIPQAQALVGVQAFGQQLNELLKPLAQQLNEFAAQSLKQTLAQIDLTPWVEAWKRAQPPNWRNLDGETAAILTLMRETGWCLVWSPRAEVIRRLLDTPDLQARERILLESNFLVLEDLRASLADSSRPELADHRTAASRAIDAFADGHFEAAQALVASDISALTNGLLCMDFAKAKGEMAGEPMDSSLTEFRTTAVLDMVSRSFQKYYAHLGDPVPKAFSRHATAHSISPRQLTEVNSLASLLLLVAFIRELDLLLEAEDGA
jgi:hypothetical protein